MSAVVVRDAVPDDAAAILGVRNTTWQTAYAHVFPAESLRGLGDAVEDWTESLRERIASPAGCAHTLVVEADGRIAGFASLGSTGDGEDYPEHVGELYAIYVLPDAQGQGIGQALMVETLSRLRAEAFSEAVLWVLEDNPRTRRFYELSGWRPDGSVKEEEWLGTLVREVRYRIALKLAA